MELNERQLEMKVEEIWKMVLFMLRYSSDF